MNTEYVWWVVVLLLVGVGAVVFLAIGPVPEIADEEPGADGPVGGHVPAGIGGRGVGQSFPVSTVVPGSDEPVATSETP
jgi:hypothetical protein